MGPRGPQGLIKIASGAPGIKNNFWGGFFKIQIFGYWLSVLVIGIGYRYRLLVSVIGIGYQYRPIRNRKINISKIVDTSGPKNRIFQNFPPSIFFNPRGPWGYLIHPWGPRGPIKNTFKNKVKLIYIYI